MIVYAESSAVLAWLLNESGATAVRHTLREAGQVVSSALTEVECARALTRGATTGILTPTGELAARRLLDAAVRTWITLAVIEPVQRRAMAPFPAEPVRTLDALHLATAITFRDAGLEVTVVSLDHRVRGNATALGLPILP